MNNPEGMMKMSKKGKTVMMFVRINNFKDKEETEEISSIWQTGLYNSHIQVGVYNYALKGLPSYFLVNRHSKLSKPG